MAVLDSIGFDERYRRKRGWQREAAEALGVSQSTLSRNLYAKNKSGPEEHFMESVAAAVGKQVDEIFPKEAVAPTFTAKQSPIERFITTRPEISEAERVILRFFDAIHSAGPATLLTFIRHVHANEVRRSRKRGK